MLVLGKFEIKNLWVRSSLNFGPKMTFALKVNEEFWASLSLNNFMSKSPRNVWANLSLDNFMPKVPNIILGKLGF